MAMEIGFMPPLPMGLVAAAMRELVTRTAQLPLPRWQVQPYSLIAVFVGLSVAWLTNSHDWHLGSTRLLVAVCSAAAVAAIVLCAGWASQPDRPGRWML